MLGPAAQTIRNSLLTALPDGLRTHIRRAVSAPLVVLLYHRVLPEIEGDVNQLAVSCSNFQDQLEWLNRHAEVVDEDAFLELLDRRTRFRRPRVLITFDDGYADNVLHALPVLQGFEHTALMFATSDAIGSGQPFWWDLLERLVAQLTNRDVSERERLAVIEMPDGTAVSGEGGLGAVYDRLHRLLKPLPTDPIRDLLSGLAQRYGFELTYEQEDLPASWAQLRAWRDAGMQLGAHTQTHAPLATLAREQIVEEIEGSKRALETHLGGVVQTFSYPYGARGDFDDRAIEALRAAGFRCAFANWEGNARWAHGPYTVPRYLVRNWTQPEFARRMKEWLR